MRTLTRASLLAGIAATIPLAALAQDAPAATEPATAEAVDAEYDAGTVLAVVNGTEITLGHVVTLRERLPEQFQALPDETLLDGLISQLVDQELLARTISEDPEDDPLAVRLHVENERRGTLAQQAVMARIADEIDDEMVQSAYDDAFAGFEAETEYRAAHILVETEDEATTVREELDAGAEFATLAEERSQDPGSAQRGGDLGWFGSGQMVQPFDEAVQDLEPGELSEPVESQFGWHVIRLDETRETEPPALEQVRPQIEEQLRQQRLADALEELRAAADVERPEAAVPASAIRDTSILED